MVTVIFNFMTVDFYTSSSQKLLTIQADIFKIILQKFLKLFDLIIIQALHFYEAPNLVLYTYITEQRQFYLFVLVHIVINFTVSIKLMSITIKLFPYAQSERM